MSTPDERPTLVPCLHENFHVQANVARIVDEDKPLRFRAEIRIVCVGCNKPFMFEGIDAIGFRQKAPSLDVSRQELNVPIAPWDGQIAQQATYEMPT